MKILNKWTLKIIFENGKKTLEGTLLDALKEGVDLRGADLSGAYLRGADLSGADLSGAYLSGAYLSGAYLRGADLSGADLSGADLSGAYLRGADLSGADLSGAYLRGADLSGAKNTKAFQCGECNRISFAIKWESEVMFKIGCFWGNTETAILKVRKKYGENSYYEKLIKLYTEMLEEGK